MGRLSKLTSRSLLFWVHFILVSAGTKKSVGDDLKTRMKKSIFFNIEELRAGETKALHFPMRSNTFGKFITREEADSIPFSRDELPWILNHFGVAPGSQKANLLMSTLRFCEIPPQSEVFKACFTSFESMLETMFRVFNISSSSSSNKVWERFIELTPVSGHSDDSPSFMTTVFRGPHETAFQNYTVLEAPREVPTHGMVGCHQMTYPYAVYYCHVQPGETKVLQVPLLGERDRVRVDAVAACHFDTSLWDPDHIAFLTLGSKPGNPVCHFVAPHGNLVWIHTSSRLTSE